MHDPGGEGSDLRLSDEEFAALSLRVQDGAAGPEELRILTAELQGPKGGLRRQHYVALSRLRGTLLEVLGAAGACIPGEDLGESGGEAGDDLLLLPAPKTRRGEWRNGSSARLRAFAHARRPVVRPRGRSGLPVSASGGLAGLAAAAAILIGVVAGSIVFFREAPGTDHGCRMPSGVPSSGRGTPLENSGGPGESLARGNVPGQGLLSGRADGDPGDPRGESVPLPAGENGAPRHESELRPFAGDEPSDRAAGTNDSNPRWSDSSPAPSPSTSAALPPRGSPSAPSAVLATPAGVVRADRVEGEVELVEGSGERRPFRAGEAVPALAGIQTLGSTSGVRLLFADGTVLDAGGETRILQIAEADPLAGGSGKRVTVLHGSLHASVAKQSPEAPMIFITPHGQIRVLGTSLRIRVEPGPGGQTRLDVEEGLVRFTRTPDGRSTLVGTGFGLQAGLGTGPLLALPASSDEILLRAQDATLVGNDWGVVREDKSAAGLVLHSPRGTMRAESVARSTSYASFLVPVEAGKEYFIWVRGACVWRNNARFQHDAIALVTHDGRFSKTNLARPTDQTAYLFNGWGEELGEREATYFWLGGDGSSDSVTVRFAQSGWATLSLHAMEGPMRVDAIWLSTSQKSLPAPEMQGPPAGRR